MGVRATTATVGIGLFAASLAILGAGSDGPRPVRYEVSATLELASDGTVYGCYAFLLSMPPDGCGGIMVRDVPADQIRNMARDAAGAQLSPPERLVGTWDGHALTLTEPPQPAERETPLPQPCRQYVGSLGGPDMLPRERQVFEDQRGPQGRGILILETMPCDSTTLGIVVAVADDDTVTWLTSHYQPVKVAGWLRPLSNGR